MVEKGSIIRVDYEAWTEDGELFDTTKKDVAKEADEMREDVTYAPLPIVVGTGRVVPGFDRALEEAPVGEEREVTIPAAEAFGERDPSKVETVSLREFQKRDVDPYPGMRLQMGERAATVMSVSPGRVRLDYNPPFAGKTLRYKFTITEALEDDDARVRALVESAYGQGRGEDFGIDVADGTVSITLPDSCKYDQRWMVAKYRIVADLRAHTGLKTIRFVEEYEATPEAAGAEAIAQAAAAHDHDHAHAHDHDHDHDHDHSH